MEQMELAEGRESFQTVVARHASIDQSAHHVAAPVRGGSGRSLQHQEGFKKGSAEAGYCCMDREREYEDMDIPIFPEDDEENGEDEPTLGGGPPSPGGRRRGSLEGKYGTRMEPCSHLERVPCIPLRLPAVPGLLTNPDHHLSHAGVNSLNSHRGGVARNQNSFVVQGELEGRHIGEGSRSSSGRRLYIEQEDQVRSHAVHIDGRRSADGRRNNCGRRNPCSNGRSGECCVGNGSWNNMLAWMGLLSDSVLH